jgi:diaminopimelate epimerase
MRLWKAHALGNDYLVLATPRPLDPAVVRHLCDRHRGPGADGVLEPRPADGAFGVRIWNPDGSVAERSGNGLRIYARFLVEHRGAPARLILDTGAVRSACEVTGDLVRAEMGVARIGSAAPVEALGASCPAREVDLGNPHVVLRPRGTVPWPAFGAAAELLPRFPNRTNVQVVDMVDGASVSIRIWERGAGETLASGSSATAVAAAGVADGWLPVGAIQVHMPGGTVVVEVEEGLRCALTGPVSPVGWFEM